VDYYNISAIPPQEAVARIKDKTMVTLTVLRGLVAPTRNPDHIYDEILYADQMLSQPESQLATTGLLQDSLSRKTRGQRSVEGFHTAGEKGSKDSGLSSGSSSSPEHQKPRPVMDQGVVYPPDAPLERISNIRKSYRTEREMARRFLKTRQPRATDHVSREPDSNCRIEGDYEVEVG